MTTYNNYYLGNKNESNLITKQPKLPKMAKISENGKMDKNKFK